jgi:integrase
MKKLRFKNRNGILYFGVGGKFLSSKMNYNSVNKNIIIGKFNRGEIDSELSTNNSCYLVNDLVKKVIDEKAKHLKHKSMLAYNSSFYNHIVPFFEGKTAAQIKPIHIKQFQDGMVENGLKKESLRLARILLKEAFVLAILGELINNNPVDAIGMPNINYKKEKQHPFTLDEIDLLLEQSHGELKNFIGILLFTGMRSGELLALQWNDVNFETETITINKTIASGIINSAKTKSSEREIEIIDKAKEFFKDQKSLTGLKNSFVFLNTQGKHYGTNSQLNHKYRKLLNEIGIKKRTLHNTRHTFASIMLNNGIDPFWVSNMLGHSNMQVTLKIYAHYMPKQEKMCLPFLEKRYNNGTDSL